MLSPDVDECSENLHACSDLCINILGSYTCSCSEGFQLEDDLRTCTGMYMKANYEFLHIHSKLHCTMMMEIAGEREGKNGSSRNGGRKGEKERVMQVDRQTEKGLGGSSN